MILMANETPKSVAPQKPKTNLAFWGILLSGAIIGILWLLTLTDLAAAFDVKDVAGFQKNIFYFTLLLTIVWLTAIVFVFYFKNWRQEYKETEGGAVILVDAHSQFPHIIELAKYHYHLQLGDCVRTKPLNPDTPLGAIPPLFSFLFEILDKGRVVGFAEFRQARVRKITTFLYDAYYVRRETALHYWDGEPKESRIGFGDSFALKKSKDVQVIDSDGGSMTSEGSGE